MAGADRRRPRERYVQKLLSLVPEHPDILEISCGAGIEPTPTLARVGRLIGIDVSGAQIERARAAIPQTGSIRRGTASAAESSQRSTTRRLEAMANAPATCRQESPRRSRHPMCRRQHYASSRRTLTSTLAHARASIQCSSSRPATASRTTCTPDCSRTGASPSTHPRFSERTERRQRLRDGHAGVDRQW